MKTLLPASMATAAGLLILTSGVQAKGPMEMEVSGGGLNGTVRVPGTVTTEEIYPLTEAERISLAQLDGESPYTVSFVFEDEANGERHPIFRLEYYPETVDHPAIFNDRTGDFVPANFPWSVPADVQQKLESVGAVVTAAQGPGDGGMAAEWLLIPAGIVGLVAIGGAGRRYLRHRPRP